MEKKISNDVLLIKASELSVNDSFMNYLPKTHAERKLMISLVEIISKSRPKNFYCFIHEPSYSDDGFMVSGTLIPCSQKGVTFYEWEKISKELAPGNKSRIGVKREFILMLGVAIKLLIKIGWEEEEAWNAICNNPEKIMQSTDNSPEILFLKNLLKTHVMIDVDSYGDTAFHLVDTGKNFFNFYDVDYQISEYDYVVDNYFNDYTFPCGKSPFQDTLDSLSKEAPDVKDEKRNAIAWIIMDAD